MYVAVAVARVAVLIPGLGSDQAALHLRDIIPGEGEHACTHHSLGSSHRPLKSSGGCSRQCYSCKVPQGQVRLDFLDSQSTAGSDKPVGS